MSLRLATRGCIRKVAVSWWRSALGGFGWSRNMADSSGKTATSAGAQEPGGPVVKTEKQLKKEAAKNAKLAKYHEKMAMQKAQNAGEVKKQNVSLDTLLAPCSLYTASKTKGEETSGEESSDFIHLRHSYSSGREER